MEIRALLLAVTDQDLEALARKHLPADLPIEELRLRITPEGVAVSGEYPLFVTVSFDMLWELEVRGGKVVLRLGQVRALGLPVTIFRSMVLRMIPEQIGRKPWLQLEDDALVVDVDRWAQEERVTLLSRLRSIRCGTGEMTVEAG